MATMLPRYILLRFYSMEVSGGGILRMRSRRRFWGAVSLSFLGTGCWAASWWFVGRKCLSSLTSATRVTGASVRGKAFVELHLKIPGHFFERIADSFTGRLISPLTLRAAEANKQLARNPYDSAGHI
jgi:hypothetical protein